MSKTQEILLECECNGYHFVQIYYDPDWQETFITHIERPKGWRQKLHSIWQILKGSDIFDGDLIIKHEDYKRLATYFSKPKNRPKNKPDGDDKSE